jgi:phosphate transport system protein
MERTGTIRFDPDLGELNSQVLRMGGEVEVQLARAMEALRNEDLALAQRVVDRDRRVNSMDVEAHERAVALLASRHPEGWDLRFVIALFKVVTDLERAGDEVERIARMTLQMFGGPASAPNRRLLRDTQHMASLAAEMLRLALNALARLDVEQAVTAARRDSELDREFQEALRRLAALPPGEPDSIEHAIEATFILKSLERIGDHAKNVAESVIYLVAGKDVRHVHPESLGVDLTDDA